MYYSHTELEWLYNTIDYEPKIDVQLKKLTKLASSTLRFIGVIQLLLFN